MSPDLAPPRDELAPVADKRSLQFGFRIGGFNFLVGRGCFCEVLIDAGVYRLPNSPEILSGLTNLRGNLVPVYRLETLFEREACRLRQRYVLVLGKVENAVGICVDTIPRGYDLTGTQRLNAPPAVPPFLAPAIKGGYLLDGSHWLEFDHESFFDQIL